MSLTRSFAPAAALLALGLTSALGAAPAVADTAAAAPASATPCAHATPAPVVTGAVFNDPAAGDPTAVVEQVCNLVKQAPAGARIRLAHFVISGDAGMDFTNELLAAHERGVDVQVVLDGWQIEKAASAKLIQELGQDEPARSWVHVCSHESPEGNTSSCIGTKGQHNKFYLFSETGGEEDVVIQSSANFTDLNSRTYWNNALTFTGNHKLYEAYNSYFEDLAAEIQDADYYRTVSTGMQGGQVTAHFFPSAAVDPVLDRVNELGCKANGSTEFRIGMSEWDEDRAGIADRLVEMAAQGCTVQIVHGPMDDSVRDRLAAQPGISLRELDSSQLPGRIHSKYMIAENATGAGSSSQLVMTGSHNWNTTSLHRNDEAIVETTDAGIYEQYKANFGAMWAAAQ